ncbi:MAG: TrkH family potassium uptake protein [SAR324 cluster bacterium]|nr:TrkH family potassium uptake protein [SAR324 cluster bacterium]
MNFFTIFYVLGSLLIFTGSMMIFPAIVSLIYNQGDIAAFLISMVISISAGFPLWWFFRRHSTLNIKDSFFIASIGWILVSAASALPFVIHGTIPSFTDSFFEMMSGYTTTGSTILSDIESMPHGLLFWRSFTHLLGGMGFIMLIIIVLPFVSMEGMYLYRAEASPGQVLTREKFNPQVKGTAIRLWIIYLGLNFLNTMLLWMGGMPLFDSMCHAFGTLSTSGYSTKNASFGHYNSAYFDWITIIFMFLGGVTFLLHYQILKRQWGLVKINTEFRWYIGITLFFCAIVSWDLWDQHMYEGPMESIRYGTFQVVSILTTTGFTTTDYELWPQAAQMFLFVVMFVGASAGSTTSGIKIIHYAVIFKHLNATIKKLLRPLEVYPIQINGNNIDSQLVDIAVSYFVINILWVLGGGGLMVLLDDMDYFSAMNSVIATLMNIGPGFGEVGPSHNFSGISDSGKWFLSLSMLTGRLEMFSVVVLFFPSFWKE